MRSYCLFLTDLTLYQLFQLTSLPESTLQGQRTEICDEPETLIQPRRVPNFLLAIQTLQLIFTQVDETWLNVRAGRTKVLFLDQNERQHVGLFLL